MQARERSFMGNDTLSANGAAERGQTQGRGACMMTGLVLGFAVHLGACTFQAGGAGGGYQTPVIGGSAPSRDALSGDEVRALITGNTLQGSILTERLVMVFYADGVVRGQMGLSGSDSGTWEIVGDKYCNEWVTYFEGVPRCYRWIPQGDGYLLDNVDAFKVHPIKGRIIDGKPKGY